MSVFLLRVSSLLDQPIPRAPSGRAVSPSCPCPWPEVQPLVSTGQGLSGASRSVRPSAALRLGSGEFLLAFAQVGQRNTRVALLPEPPRQGAVLGGQDPTWQQNGNSGNRSLFSLVKLGCGFESSP